MPLDGVAFSRLDWLKWRCIFNRVTRMGTFLDFWGKKIILSRDWKWSRLKSSESCCLLNVTITSHYIPFLKVDALIESDLVGIAKITFSQKVTKMGSITGHKIDYNGAGALRGQRHIPSKIEPKYPPPPPRGAQTGKTMKAARLYKIHLRNRYS